MGEDTGTDPGHGDGELTPPSSAAGALPPTVTTDEYGVANFDLLYLKAYAVWIDAEIEASTIVVGTETISTFEFTLRYAKGDEPYLSNSPWGPGTVTITASAGPNGSISHVGSVPVDYLDSQTFTITPLLGYHAEVTVDTDPPIIGAVDQVIAYTFSNVTADHTIDAIFVLGP